MDESIMQQLDLLNKLRGIGGDNGELSVSSIKGAISLLQMHMTPNDAQYRKELVDYITDPSNRVLSECDVYHNFIMDLFRVGDYDLALTVCDFALKAAPFNRDMLGDAIKACGDSSQFEKGEEYLKKASEIPYKLWSFRLFLYSVDFLKTKLNAYPMDEELYQRALKLAREYINAFPYDEHGYNQESEILIMMNQREDAVLALTKYIKDTRPDTQSDYSLVTAQCCVTLLNILDDSSNYDSIIEICDMGLRNTTQEQPSAAIGFFVYRKALALDAKAHAEMYAGHNADDIIKSALKFYQSAYDLNQDRQYARTIEQRYTVLRPHTKDFQPLVKRSLYVSEMQNTNIPVGIGDLQ